MSATQSNLSEPKFGYDLVVAVTQASVNATMKQFLAGLQAPEVVACYVYDASDNLVPIEYDELKKQAKGSDPFTVADGAEPNTDQDLINLTAANFAGGFKAAIGLPELPLPSLPPIVTLSNGTDAPVLFNLLCSEFQIVGFEYGPRGKSSWLDKRQPSGSGEPWYFSANVKLNPTGADPSDPSLSSAVKARIVELDNEKKAGEFSIQKLLFDLDNAFLAATPTIEGIPPGWAVWTLISQVFLGAYLKQLREKGEPVLGYTFAVTQPEPSTLQLGAITMECGALLEKNGQPIPTPTAADKEAATLEYLGTASTTPPTAVEFPWNWVELGDVSAYSGAQAVRRDIFIDFLADLLSSVAPQLCFATHVSLTHSGDDYRISYWSEPGPNPTRFQPVAIGAPGPDGFTEVLNVSYVFDSSDESEAADHMSSIYGEFNYNFNGTVAFQGNQIRITLNPVVYMRFHHHELGINYEDLHGKNYYDKTRTVIWQMAVDSTGQLKVIVASDTTVDNSAELKFTPGGILGLFGQEDGIRDALEEAKNDIASALDYDLTGYVGQAADEVNGYHGWVFPGSSTFFLKDVQFATSLDLITELSYRATG